MAAYVLFFVGLLTIFYYHSENEVNNKIHKENIDEILGRDTDFGLYGKEFADESYELEMKRFYEKGESCSTLIIGVILVVWNGFTIIKNLF